MKTKLKTFIRVCKRCNQFFKSDKRHAKICKGCTKNPQGKK